MPKRPFPKEKNKKVRDGLEAVRSGQHEIALEKHIPQAFDFLGIRNKDELWLIIEALLTELNEVGAENCYCGKNPPEQSYDVPKEELWPYAWDSAKLGKRVYLKFIIKKGYFLFIDCHES